MLKTYSVVSPLMTENIGYLESLEIGPPEQFCCVADVEAANKREAVRIAVQSPEFREWRDQQRGDGLNPFVGVKATEVDYVLQDEG